MTRGIAFVAAVALLAPGPVPCSGDAPRETSRTDVALTTEAPIREGRNLLWCATIQLAWDALADAVGEDGRLVVGPPAPPDVVATLNRRTFPHRDLDDASCLAVGGDGPGVVDRIREGWKARWPDVPPPDVRAGPLDVVGFAALRKDLPFEYPFRVLDGTAGIERSDGPARAFGLKERDYAAENEPIARQVRLYGGYHAGMDSDEYPIVEIHPKGGQDVIVLAAVEPARSLEATWTKVAWTAANRRRTMLPVGSLLAIPRLRVETDHSFAELVGAEVEGVGTITEARQSVSAALTESGAKAESVAVIKVHRGGAPRADFRGTPFLVAMGRRDATRPYLLLWVANDDVLDRSP